MLSDQGNLLAGKITGNNLAGEGADVITKLLVIYDHSLFVMRVNAVSICRATVINMADFLDHFTDACILLLRVQCLEFHKNLPLSISILGAGYFGSTYILTKYCSFVNTFKQFLC